MSITLDFIHLLSFQLLYCDQPEGSILFSSVLVEYCNSTTVLPTQLGFHACFQHSRGSVAPILGSNFCPFSSILHDGGTLWSLHIKSEHVPSLYWQVLDQTFSAFNGDKAIIDTFSVLSLWHCISLCLPPSTASANSLTQLLSASQNFAAAWRSGAILPNCTSTSGTQLEAAKHSPQVRVLSFTPCPKEAKFRYCVLANMAPH